VQWARQWKLRVLRPEAAPATAAADPTVQYLFPTTAGRSADAATTPSATSLVSATLTATGGLGADVVLQWHRPGGAGPGATAHTVALCLASAGRWVTNQRDLQVGSDDATIAGGASR
jgi:hypothetical protein